MATTLNNIRINITEYNKESKKKKKNTSDSKKMPKLRKLTNKNVGKEMLPDFNENKQFKPGKIITIDSVEIHNSDNTCEDKNVSETDLPRQENSCDVVDPILVESWMKSKKSLTANLSTSPATGFFFFKVQVSNSITTIEDKTEKVNIAPKYTNERNGFRVSLTKDYPHKESMSNGLFLNPKYYMTDEEFFVSMYNNLSPTTKLALYTHVFEH